MEREKFLSAIYLIIKNEEGKALLQRRQGTKLWPGFLALPAGHIDSKENLIACKHSVEETAKIIGADSLGYLSVESAKKLAHGDEGTGYCTACFDGKYPGGIPQETRKNRCYTKNRR